jgi:hypothetical protein
LFEQQATIAAPVVIPVERVRYAMLEDIACSSAEPRVGARQRVKVVQEILGPGHHFVMWAYRSERVGVVPDRFSGHHVSAVWQERWHQLERDPTDMPILNDAGAAAYPWELIADRLAREQIVMSSLLTGDAFRPA